MEYLGMFCLGAFVGGIVTLGLSYMNNLDNFTKLLATILSAVLSGVVLGFINMLGGQSIGPGLYAYPVGLLIALLWYYAKNALDNIKSPDKSLNLLGWLHLTGVIIATLAAAYLVVPPAFGHPWLAPTSAL